MGGVPSASPLASVRRIVGAAGRAPGAAIPARWQRRELKLLAHFRDRWAVLGLAAAFVLALAVYWPGLTSPFYGDDYRYLLASRDMSWGSFLRDAFYPWADPAGSEIAADHWRPLSWTWFRVQYLFFGEEPPGYHLTSFAAHLAGVTMVWLLGRRLSFHPAGVAAATLAFAVHPAGFESVVWISALSLVGFPLALGGLLTFMVAVDTPARRRRWWLHAAALSLLTAGLLNRETVVAIFPTLGCWYLLVGRRRSPGDMRAYLPLVPYVVLVAVYALVNTWFFTVRSDQKLSADLQSLENGWLYVRQALVPTSMEGNALVTWAQQGLGLAVMCIPLCAVAARRRVLLALSLGFLGSIVPYAMFNVGSGPRYFYFPGALFALVVGSATTEVTPRLKGAFRGQHAVLASRAGLLAVAAVVAVVGNRRVDNFVETVPDVQQQWVNDLKRNYPQLPDGGTLYVTNVPFRMGLLNGFVLQPTVDYLYPEGTHRVKIFYRVDLEDVRPWLEPNDRLFVFGEQ